MNMHAPHATLALDAVDRYAEISEQIRRLEAERDALRKTFIKVTGGDGVLRGRVHSLKVTTSTSRRLDVEKLREVIDPNWLADYEVATPSTRIAVI